MNIYGIIYLLFAHLTKNYLSENTQSQNNYNCNTLAVFKNIIEYILNHYTENISIDDLAKRSYLSKQSLYRGFKQITGTSIKSYILDLRIKKACDMLIHTNTNITEIAFSCGFNDANYFTRVFKKYTGTTPKEMRNNNEHMDLLTPVLHHDKNIHKKNKP